MYSHGRLLLPGGEGMGVGCPYLAPPGRERGGGASLPLRGASCPSPAAALGPDLA
jgi:hypothetical protein